MIRFSEPQEYIVTSTQPINLFLAGIGRAKTFIIGFISGFFIKYFPHVFGFIGANTHHQLTTSTLFRVRKVWKEIYGWVEDVDYVINKKPPRTYKTDLHEFDDYHGIISFKHGAVVFRGSLENAKAHDGKEFGWAFLDETKDSREEDVKETILTRMRMPGMYVTEDGQLVDESEDSLLGDLNEPFNPLYILTSPARVDWINEWFELDEKQTEILDIIHDEDEFYLDEFKDKCVVISSTYHNRENLPSNFIQRILDNNSKEGGKRLIYGNPFVKVGGEFYSGFDRFRQVRKVDFNPDLPIHISFDQNVKPYITATLYQVEYFENERVRIGQFDEICLANPRNKTEQLCIEFIKRYGSRCKGLYFYGDPSGKHADTRSLEHDYKIVERLLRKYLNNSSNRVPHKHPGVLKRRDFANNIFEGVYSNIEFFIDPKCKKSIADFEYVKEDINGKKLKRKVKDKLTGESFEKYGHTSDSFDYFITKVLSNIFARYFK